MKRKIPSFLSATTQNLVRQVRPYSAPFRGFSVVQQPAGCFPGRRGSEDGYCNVDCEIRKMARVQPRRMCRTLLKSIQAAVGVALPSQGACLHCTRGARCHTGCLCCQLGDDRGGVKWRCLGASFGGDAFMSPKFRLEAAGIPRGSPGLVWPYFCCSGGQQTWQMMPSK